MIDTGRGLYTYGGAEIDSTMGRRDRRLSSVSGRPTTNFNANLVGGLRSDVCDTAILTVCLSVCVCVSMIGLCAERENASGQVNCTRPQSKSTWISHINRTPPAFLFLPSADRPPTRSPRPTKATSLPPHLPKAGASSTHFLQCYWMASCSDQRCRWFEKYTGPEVQNLRPTAEIMDH